MNNKETKEERTEDQKPSLQKFLQLKSLEKKDVCASNKNSKCVIAKIKHYCVCLYINLCTATEILGQFLVMLNKL